MKKEKSVKFDDNDIYFMEILDNFIITNYNYKGILILDDNLNIIDTLVLFEGMLIYDSFKMGNKILLYCLENDCFVYIDIITREISKIEIVQKNDCVFSKLYDWDGNNIILRDYYNNYMIIDLSKMETFERKIKENKQSSIINIDRILDNKKVVKYDSENKIVIVQGDESNIIFFNIKNSITCVRTCDREDFHDFEMFRDCFIKISENRIELNFAKDNTTIYPLDDYMFCRAKIMSNNMCLYVLSSNKSIERDVMIEKFEIIC